jgi:hypothetical protein
VHTTTDIDKRQYIDPISGDYYNLAIWKKTPEFQKNLVRYHDRVFHETKRSVHLDARRLEVQFQGHLVKCSLRGGVPRPAPAKRGTIHEFSSQSRSRLIELFSRFKKPAHTTFITLTYGAEFPSPEIAKENLRAFLERLRRMKACARSSAIWRIELQERGAPHFHLICFDLPYIEKEEIQRMWGEIIDVERPFTRIEAVRSWNGIMFYCSKYIAKKQDDFRGGINGFIYLSYLHGLGRVWGVFQKQNLPFATLKIINWPFIAKAFTKFRKCAEALWPALIEQESPGFKLYVLNAMQWVEIWNNCAEIVF